jgi:GH25 family lysozyme M1 (1,4-beta-N-acetylmuramidase)
VRLGLRTWLQLVRARLGRKPVVYVTAEAYQAFLKDSDVGYDIWL